MVFQCQKLSELVSKLIRFLEVIIWTDNMFYVTGFDFGANSFYCTHGAITYSGVRLLVKCLGIIFSAKWKEKLN